MKEFYVWLALFLTITLLGVFFFGFVGGWLYAQHQQGYL